MIFPSPARMSPTKLSLVGNKSMFPGQRGLVSDIQAWDRKIANLFIQCRSPDEYFFWRMFKEYQNFLYIRWRFLKFVGCLLKEKSNMQILLTSMETLTKSFLSSWSETKTFHLPHSPQPTLFLVGHYLKSLKITRPSLIKGLSHINKSLNSGTDYFFIITSCSIIYLWLYWCHQQHYM